MKRSVVAWVVTTAILAGTSLALVNQLGVERARTAAALEKVQQLEHELSTLPPSPPPTSGATFVIAEQPDAAPTSTPTAPQSNVAPGFTTAPDREALMAQLQARARMMRERLNDPEHREAVQKQQRFMMGRYYSDLGTALRLTPEQRDALLDMLANQQVTRMASASTFAEEGLDPQQQAEHMANLERRHEAEISALLGPGKLQEWKDYQASMSTRAQVRELRMLLADSSEPLRAEDAEPLIAALAKEEQRTRFEPPGPNANVDPNAMRKRYLEAQIQARERQRQVAASYLTARQQAAFDELIEQQISMLQMQLDAPAPMMGNVAYAEAAVVEGRTVPAGAIAVR